MKTLDEKFKALEADNAPGQEVRQDPGDLNSLMRGERLDGVPVDFSHGDVDAFPPTPGSDMVWKDGFDKGSSQAYTEYRGLGEIRNRLAESLGKFTERPIDAVSSYTKFFTPANFLFFVAFVSLFRPKAELKIP